VVLKHYGELRSEPWISAAVVIDTQTLGLGYVVMHCALFEDQNPGFDVGSHTHGDQPQRSSLALSLDQCDIIMAV